MKAIKLVAILAMLSVPFSVRAACPVQETTVVFINGVWTPKPEAEKHKNALELAAREKGISPSCVHFDYSHTQDDTKQRDVVEALIQISNEQNIPLITLVRAFLRVFTPTSFVSLALDEVLATEYRDTMTIIDTQLDKHLKKFRDVALNLNQRGIALTHSQGGLYGNAMLGIFNPTERLNTRLVSVVTPSDTVADGGPNTRLSRDGVANVWFLIGNAEGIILNTDRLCDTEAEAKLNSSICHGFETGYLHDVEARAQIVGDIKKALPSATISGRVRGLDGLPYFGGATVSLFSSPTGTLLAETTTAPGSALYRFDNVPAPCPACFLKAKSVSENICGSVSAPAEQGSDVLADVALTQLFCNVPTPDTTPPSIPTNLVATAVSSSQINITWTASTDNVAVTGYKIFRRGTQVATSATNSFSDIGGGLNPSTSYSYTVSAFDAAGWNSGLSTSASATTH